MKPSPYAIEMFTPVLAWLEAGAPHTKENIGFNMNKFVTPRADDFENKSCGTACCIAGAVQQFNKLPQSVFYTPWHPIRDLGTSLGMTVNQSMALFYAANKTWWDHDGENLPDGGSMLPDDQSMYKITPAQAAQTLRHFMETGEVVWS